MNILAIGGGNKTPAIQAALDSLPDQDPHVVLVPTACSLESSYNRKVSAASQFFGELGVKSSVLHEFEQAPSQTQLEHELGQAAMIYTIGGNSPYMLRTMKAYGIDNAIVHAVKNGAMHAGASAGALLPFSEFHSNVAVRPTQEDWDFAFLRGVGLLRGVATAHASTHDPTPLGLRKDSRLEHLIRHFPQNAVAGLGLENNAAVLFGDTGNSVILADAAANAHLIRRTREGIESRPISDSSELDIFNKG